MRHIILKMRHAPTLRCPFKNTKQRNEIGARGKLQKKNFLCKKQACSILVHVCGDPPISLHWTYQLVVKFESDALRCKISL